MKDVASVGTKFSRLTILGYIGGRRLKCRVRCDCGTVKEIRYDSLIRENFATKSCGCLHMEQCRERPNSTIHGDARKNQVTRLHNTWRGMLSKCYRESCDRFPYYGARGINICDEWHEYVPFRDWAMSHGYDDKLTIHRRDNDGNYEPSNCTWTDQKTQARNTRRTHWVLFNGERMSLAECAEKNNISYHKLENRLRRGWPIERAIVN